MKREVIQAPMGETKVLLHTCCAPCSSAIIEALVRNGITPVIYYCNPNIFPSEEYAIRRDECTRYARSLGLEIVDADYDHETWLEAVKGLEDEPERGGRCLRCFKLRLLRTAEYAREHGIRVITTTLASSRWKSLDQINEAGRWACATAVTVPEPHSGAWSACPSGAVGLSRLGVDHPVRPDDRLSGRISVAPFTSARCSQNIAAVTVPEPHSGAWSACPSGAVGLSRLGVDHPVPPDDRQVIWWDRNWRKGGLQERRLQIIKDYGFYNQQYCGCEFSMRRLQPETED